jgi:hypothetical protein
MPAGENITPELNYRLAWKCVCGNTPLGAGFHPCDHKGRRVQPVNGWRGDYACHLCGRIISRAFLENQDRLSDSH